MQKYAAVILAAGKGTRMNEGTASPIPKVMYELSGKPIISYAVKSVQDAGIEKIVLVVGYKKETVQDYMGSKVEDAIQQEQLGTGHAVKMAKELLEDKVDAVIVFGGDCPLFKPETIKKLIDIYEERQPTIAMLSVISDDPTGYGRILREDESGHVTGIVEQKDCTPDQALIKEWNPAFYIFNSKWLWENIDRLSTENAQNEYYLTDLISMAVSQGKRLYAMPVSEESEAFGINTPAQQKAAEGILKQRSADGDIQN